MWQNAHITVRRAFVAGAISVAAIAFVGDAFSQSRVKGEYAQSRQPIPRVGTLSNQLSALCRKGLFKQRKPYRLSIGYVGQRGQGITGIAQRGWNLYDPTRVAEPDVTYHFFNQGYSNCRVYVAENP